MPGAGPDRGAARRIGANLPQLSAVVRANADSQPYGAVPGALAESVRCTIAVARVRPWPPPARSAASTGTPRELPEDPESLFTQCVLSMVDLGTITGSGATREQQVAAADAALAKVVAARPAAHCS